MSGAVSYNGRRVWSGAHVFGSPTPGKGLVAFHRGDQVGGR